MKKASIRMFYLCIIFLLILSACGQKLVIELPEEEVAAAPEEADTGDEPEDPPEDIETAVEDLLGVGTAMKWFDDGYVVFVPQAEVTLGDNEYENNPVYTVDIDDFWIYMFKVTNGQYRHCVATGTCAPPASEEPYPDLEDPSIKDEPVIGVTWDQADTYCNWMKGRLPTKAEWEKAARGLQSNNYPWGNEDPDCDLLNYGDCEDPAITKVYEYPEGRSYYEAFDLAGNAYEWVFDLYEDDFISQLPDEPPYWPPNGTERSVRGSSYISGEELIPSAQLFYLEPEKYRTDLGFRCVIGEGEGGKPDGFANPCIQSVMVPGVPPPWIPGPQHDDPQPPDFDEGRCKTDIEVSPYAYCSNQALQHGGLDLQVASLGSDDVYIKSWTPNGGGYCDDSTDPLKCFGPEGTSITFEICATCTPPLQVDQIQFYCDCLYDLSDTNPPTCIYNGGQQVQGETCPSNFVHDQVNDICVKAVNISDECPDGYEYNPDTDCCTATFADPAPDPDKPSDSYLLCPPGTGSATLVGEWVVQGQFYAICQYLFASAQMKYCITPTYNLGDCRDNLCFRPSQYTNKTSCVAANCKWEKSTSGPTGGPATGAKCVHP